MSGPFWKFSNGFSSLSAITTLLEAFHDDNDALPNLARSLLLKLLDEDELLQELLSNNPLLLEFLRDPHVLRLLVDLVVHEGNLPDLPPQNDDVTSSHLLDSPASSHDIHSTLSDAKSVDPDLSGSTDADPKTSSDSTTSFDAKNSSDPTTLNLPESSQPSDLLPPAPHELSASADLLTDEPGLLPTDEPDSEASPSVTEETSPSATEDTSHPLAVDGPPSSEALNSPSSHDPVLPSDPTSDSEFEDSLTSPQASPVTLHHADSKQHDDDHNDVDDYNNRDDDDKNQQDEHDDNDDDDDDEDKHDDDDDDDDDDEHDDDDEEDPENKPEAETPQERAIRKSAITAEILSADIWLLTDAVMDHPEILDTLWLVLDSTTPLSINLSTYFTKIMEHLLDMKCDDMIAYLTERQPHLVQKFMNHLTNPPLMDFLLKLISTDKPDNATGIIDFLQMQGLVSSLVSALDADNDSAPHPPPPPGLAQYYEQCLLRQSLAADFLKALVTISANSATDQSTIGPNELTRELVSRSQMERLCGIMLKGGYALANGVGIIIEIIRKNNSDYDILPVLYITLGSHPPTGRDPIYLGHLLKVFGELIDAFNLLVMDSRYSDPSRQLMTPFGEIEPLGFERFKICELVAELLHCSNMALLNDNRGYDVVMERDALRAKMKAYDPASFKYNEVIAMPPTSPKLPEPTSPTLLDQDKGDADRKTDPVLGEDNANASYNDTMDSFNSKLNGDDSSMSVHQGPDHEDEDEPHANANLTEAQIRANPVVGDLLKIHLFDTQIISNILGMFFKFPWNNFLHNVVFDIVQQVLNGSMDIGFNKFLAIDLFHLGDITNKIIDGQRICAEYEEQHNGLRLGYMGHLTLIAEEVVKFVTLYPTDTLSELIMRKVDDEPWEIYVSEVLYDTREKYNAILGGGEDDDDGDDDDENNSTYEEGARDISNDLSLLLLMDTDLDHDLGVANHRNAIDNSAEREGHLESDDSESDDDDHFTTYMSQHLNDTSSSMAFPMSKDESDEPHQYDSDFQLPDASDKNDENDDEYVDPNDDGMSYKKTHPLYDTFGSLRLDVREPGESSSDEHLSSSSDEDGDDLDQEDKKSESSGSTLTRAASKS